MDKGQWQFAAFIALLVLIAGIGGGKLWLWSGSAWKGFGAAAVLLVLEFLLVDLLFRLISPEKRGRSS